MKTKTVYYPLVLAVIIAMGSCTHEQVILQNDAATEELQWKPEDGIAKFIPVEYKDNIRPKDLERAERLLRNPKEEVLTTRGREIHLASGSTNALKAAIASAGDGDVIILDPGDHYESGTVYVDKSINIQGYGANYISSGITESNDYIFKSAIHITPAGCISTIRGLTFKSTETHPGLCIYLDHTKDVNVIYNTFEQWQFGVVAAASDYNIIAGNKITCDTSWASGTIPEAEGIVFSDGSHNLVLRNEVIGGFFGIWTGGSQGIIFSNNTHHGFLGIILCKVPAGGYSVDGATIETQGSSISWLGAYNTSHDNSFVGYLVIDGAHNNLMQRNASDHNGAYDYYLVGDSHLFGFFTPKAYNNTIQAYGYQTIKDCADNSTIYGGIRVDLSKDPCGN
jgi:hypothetical protein